MCSEKTCSTSKGKKIGQLKGFLKASILLLLSRGESYGYTLQQDLIDSCLFQRVDIGTLYRNLRKLEDFEFVKSTWRESISGPEQRVYEITNKGLEQLSIWTKSIKNEREKIDIFLSMSNV